MLGTELQEAGRQARHELATREYAHFMPFVKIVEPGTGMVTLQEWPHLMETQSALATNTRIGDGGHAIPLRQRPGSSQPPESVIVGSLSSA